jgi:hypothetical protein
LEAATASAVSITEVDNSSTVENKDSQDTANGPLGFGSTTKPLTPTPVFDYARAVGLQSRQGCKRIGKKTKFCATEYVSNEVKASIDDINSEEQTGRVCAKTQVEVGSAEFTTVGSSVLSTKSSNRQHSPTGKVSSGAVRIEADVLESTLPKVCLIVVPSWYLVMRIPLKYYSYLEGLSWCTGATELPF